MKRASSLLLTRSLFQHCNRIHVYHLSQNYGSIRSLSSIVSEEAITHYTQNVQVGATLKLNLANTEAQVDVSTWENHEEIQLKAWWKGKNNKAATDVTNKDNCVCFKVEDSSYLQKLSAFMPGRWCNLVLESGNGDVKIQNMKEANIDVTTACGNVSLGEVRGNKAYIRAKGGDIIAEVISAVLDLKTGGGHLSLKKVIGTTVQIDTDGGNVKLGSAYGADINVASSGGTITINHIQAQNMAYVSSGRADIKMDGVDGYVFISSDGGNIEVQLLANAKEIKISAGTGNVTIYQPLEGDVEVEHCNDLELKNEHIRSEGKESPRCRVLVSGSGMLKIETRSWLDAVMMRSRGIS